MFLLFWSVYLQLHSQCLNGDCKDGFGTFLFQSGSKFTGTFSSAQMNKGTYYYHNGDIYKGSFLQNKRNGEGVYFYSSGNRFSGTFGFDKKIKGTFYYLSGNVYEGEFRDEARHGYGTFKFKDGKVYKGYFNHNQFLGSDPENDIKTYALVVGIASYEDYAVSDLTFTINDAMNYSSYLTKSVSTSQKEDIILLTDQNATKHNILFQLEKLFNKADENDKVVFYFSGHGSKNILIPYDFDPWDNSSALSHQEIKDIFKKCQSENKLLIADACFSGTFKKTIQEFDSTSVFTVEKGLDDPSVAIFLSCSSNEVSYEHTSLHQGVFSYFLLKGLMGEADVDEDAIITIEELFYFVRNNTYEFVKGSMGNIQRPILFGHFDREMAVAHLK